MTRDVTYVAHLTLTTILRVKLCFHYYTKLFPLPRFIDSFNKYLLSARHVLGGGDTAVNKTYKCPCPHGAFISVVGDKTKQIYKQHIICKALEVTIMEKVME